MDKTEFLTRVAQIIYKGGSTSYELEKLYDEMTTQKLRLMSEASKDGTCILLQCLDCKELVKARFCDAAMIAEWVNDDYEECPVGWYERHEYSQSDDYTSYNMHIRDEKIQGWLPLPEVKVKP